MSLIELAIPFFLIAIVVAVCLMIINNNNVSKLTENVLRGFLKPGALP